MLFCFFCKMLLHEIGNHQVFFCDFTLSGIFYLFTELWNCSEETTARHSDLFVFATEECSCTELSAEAMNSCIVCIVVDPCIAVDLCIVVDPCIAGGLFKVLLFLNPSTSLSLFYISERDKCLNTEKLLSEDVDFLLCCQLKLFH